MATPMQGIVVKLSDIHAHSEVIKYNKLILDLYRQLLS